MIINHNLNAMNAHRQLGMNTVNAGKSMEKLSSGLRINRAGDDAAGLAISEKMRAQIRGLEQAARNAQDGISLIQTAEGALNETHAILQRMRELAVQASSDTNTSVDRGEIQKEINQLTSEINRIANTTEFNTMKLLDGSRSIKTTSTSTTQNITKLVNGTGGNVTVDKSLGVSITTGEESNWQNAISGGIKIEKDASANEAIDWTNIDLKVNATVTLTKTDSGDLKVQLQATDKLGNAFTHETTLDLDAMKAAATDGKYKVSFHGVSFDLNIADYEKAVSGSSVELDLQKAVDNSAGDVTGTYGIKHDFTESGQAADFTSFSIDGTKEALAGLKTLSISFDGTYITVTGKDASDNEILKDVTKPATPLTNEGDFFEYKENGISFKFELIKNTSGSPITSFTTKDIDVSNLVAKLQTETKTETTIASNGSLKMQIGANENQSMEITISDITASALGISSKTAGTGFTSALSVSKGTDNTSVEYALDVSSAANASKAITTIDNAIQTVSSERAKLGAYQNRLEHTIANLGTSSENLTAAESRVRDVDMAKEMMSFSKNNILAQAAQAMLAQANQQPQGVLQLLR